MRFLDFVKSKAEGIGLTITELCLEADLPPATFYRRAGYVGGLTLDELTRLDIILQFSDEERLRILKRELK